MSTKITRGARSHLIRTVELIRRAHKYGMNLRGPHTCEPPRRRLHLWRSVKVYS